MNKGKINDYIKLLSDYNLNDSIIEYFENKSKNFIDNGNRISFDTFIQTDNRTKRTSYHIFFSATTNNPKTAEYLKLNYPDFFKVDVFFYILRRKENNSLIIKNINNLFSKNIKVTSVDYVSDIVKKISKIRSNLKFDRIKFDVPDAFINPTIEEIFDESKKLLKATEEFIVDWMENNEKPILVILGKGGVGKTTIAEYFSNNILKNYKNTSNIFIDSVGIKHRLSKNNDISEINLYDIYKESKKEGNVIDEYYFVKNLDFTNYFIIIDGIDELISKVKNFDIKVFLNSINNYNQTKGVKVIITCRIEYWNIKKNNIQLIELKAFDKIQMESFFKRSLTIDKKISKAIELANDFHKLTDKEDLINLYHPYALDLISSIITRKIHLTDNVKNKTERLNTNIKTDYIIAKMCFREKYHSGLPRVTDLSIDEQVKILEYIAIAHNGKVNNQQLQDAVFFGINKNLNNNIQEIDYKKYASSMLSHPLLKQDKSENITFTYDFFNDVFKAIYLAYNLSNENLLDEVKIELLKFISEFKFGSQIVNDITNRINKWEGSQKTNLSLLIELLEEEKKIDNNQKSEMFSGLFNLAYSINKRFIKESYTNKITNIKLLEDIGIKKDNNISNLCLINIVEEKILFDFSSISIFKDCVFNNYTYFWDNSNEWNSNSFFINCYFKDLGKRTSIKEIKWVLGDDYKNFDINSQKNMDDNFKEQIKNNKQISNELKSDIERFVKLFVHFFWRSPNTFYAQNYSVRNDSCKSPLTMKYPKISSLNLKLEDFILICESINFIEWDDYNRTIKTINVSHIHKSKLKKYIQTNDKPEIVEKLEKLVYDKLKIQ